MMIFFPLLRRSVSATELRKAALSSYIRSVRKLLLISVASWSCSLSPIRSSKVVRTCRKRIFTFGPRDEGSGSSSTCVVVSNAASTPSPSLWCGARPARPLLKFCISPRRCCASRASGPSAAVGTIAAAFLEDIVGCSDVFAPSPRTSKSSTPKLLTQQKRSSLMRRMHWHGVCPVICWGRDKADVANKLPPMYLRSTSLQR
mmetsp:Transcript_2874/g.6618  ORF Transcript_2874/g.6618 Transcript_2874/m.6618 type:complete len:202 (+) Transcript_2874:1338-1943(+)